MELTSTLTSSQLRYVRDVLGVENILLPPNLSDLHLQEQIAGEVPNRESEAQEFRGPSVVIFVEAGPESEGQLLKKMLQAMHLKDFQIVSSPSIEEFNLWLSRQPTIALVFGEALCIRLGTKFVRGKFLDQQGIATIVTYGPNQLLESPALKAEAWKDMKLAMGRLN